MRANDGTRTAAEVLIDQLVIHGVRHMFCVPGESYIAALDACHDRDIASPSAGRRAGRRSWRKPRARRPGGPASASSPAAPAPPMPRPGVHIARQDSTPLILFVGQIAREMREREAFQELDYRAVFGSIAKWATEIDDPARIPELVSRAFYTATSGRPGPGGHRAAGGHAGRAHRRARRARLRAGRDLARRDRHEPAAEAALGGRAADRAARRQPLVGGRPAPRSRASRNVSRCRSRPRSGARICSTRRIPATRAISASDPIPSCWRA